jgi:hypothetical protein
MATPLRRIAHRLAAAEDGIALLLALGAMAMLGTVSASALLYSQQNYGHAAHSKADQTALALAEAGLNNALATLNAAQDPKSAIAVARTSRQYEGGDAEWWGELTGNTWTLYGRGVVRNPTGGSIAVSRLVRGRATLGSAKRPSPNNAIWNYLYADDLSTCTSFSNSVVVDVPVYVRGNLCMTNSAQMTGYSLRVGGTLSISQNASVGTATEKIHEVHVGGGCILDGGAPQLSCGPSAHVYADSSDNDTSGLTKPAIDLAYWYVNAYPGPRHGCTEGSFPGGFDNDSVMNRSRPTVDLTPNTAYDCRVYDVNGYLVGRIAWTPGNPGSLIVSGTIFFDGDIAFRQQTNLVYDGRATIYSSGKITIANQTTICGAPGCPDDWNPNQSLLALIAGSSTDATGFSIGNYSKFQGAIYVVNDFRDGNNTVTWGPVIARQLYLQNSTLNYYVPIDTLVPGMPATYEEITTIQFVSGSWG